MELTEWVKIKPVMLNSSWLSRTLCAIIAPNLFNDVIIGGPFLSVNKIIIDHETRTCIAKDSNVNLLAPNLNPSPKPNLNPILSKCSIPFHSKQGPKTKAIDILAEQRLRKNDCLAQLKTNLAVRRTQLDNAASIQRPCQTLAAIRTWIGTLAEAATLKSLDQKFKRKFTDLFPDDILDIDSLSDNTLHRFRLKSPDLSIKHWRYSCPRKYCDNWQTLINQHLAKGRIRPLDSPYASPAFIIPKKDPKALPRWVNDYRKLKANTVPDSHPLPRIDDVIADCAKGRIWAKIDMTNSFFQTKVHPDNIKYTSVTTPFGLYEWTVMPMGC